MSKISETELGSFATKDLSCILNTNKLDSKFVVSRRIDFYFYFLIKRKEQYISNLLWGVFKKISSLIHWSRFLPWCLIRWELRRQEIHITRGNYFINKEKKTFWLELEWYYIDWICSRGSHNALWKPRLTNTLLCWIPPSPKDKRTMKQKACHR